MEQLANVFAVMAILISCLGLFGLASFLVERRTKEISIRKVLGASPAGLWLALSTEMLKPVILGVIVATPLAAMAMAGLLSINDYHIRLSWWIFALAGAGAILIALATVRPRGEGYSVLKLFTGLATAAFMAWKLTVIMAMAMPMRPASKNIHHCNWIR
jgi:predicted lysophospholipase L1 biosynthesis ABC-type transport system permease subunit